MGHLKIWPQSACLLTELSKEISTIPQDQIPDITVILPTTRMATFFLALLAKHFKALIPCQVITLEQFIFSQANDLTLRQPIAPTQLQEILLSKLLDALESKYLRPHHAAECQQLFAELITSGLELRFFERLKDYLYKDIFRDDSHLESLGQRISDLEQLYKTFLKELQDLNYLTYEQSLIKCSEYVKEKILDDTVEFSKIYLVGFTSAIDALHNFIETLAAKNYSRIWLSDSTPSLPHNTPYTKLRAILNRTDLLTRNHPKTYRDPSAPPQDDENPNPDQSHTAIYQLPNLTSEIGHALQIAASYRDQGIPPSQIAIIVPDEMQYGPIIKDFCTIMKLPVNYALAQPLTRTATGRWLYCLTQWLTNNRSAADFLSFLLHPLSLATFAKHVQSNPTALQQVIEDELRKHPDNFYLSALLTNTKNEIFKAILIFLNQQMPMFHCQRLTSADWLQQLLKILELFAVVDDAKDNHADQTITAIEQIIQSFQELFAHDTKTFPAKFFWSTLKTLLNRQQIHEIGEPISGIQILKLSEARYIPFAVAMILGCHEGSFPKALPPDEIVDDFLKRQGGLPGWSALEAMEDLTFELLSKRLPHLTLYFSKYYLREPQVPSRFVEMLLAVKQAKSYQIDFDIAKFFATYNCQTANGQLPQVPLESHNLQKLTLQQSATSLEYFLKCPYRFLFYKLSVNELPFPQLEPDPSQEGLWLHAVMEAFFTGFVKDQQIIDLWPKLIDEDIFSEQALTRLMTLTKLLAPHGIEKKPIFSHLQTHSWPKFITHLKKLFAGTHFSNLADGFKEFKFGSQPDQRLTTINVADQRIYLKGSIDSIDFMGNIVLVTDYKRKHSPQTKNVHLAVEPQLSFYALALQHLLREVSRRDPSPSGQDDGYFSLDHMVIGYWNIMAGEWQAIGCGEQVREIALAHQLINKKTPSLKTLTARLLSHWSWRMQLVTAQQQFTPDPSHCEFCIYSGICRKGDPRYFDYFEGQDLFKQRLEGLKELSNDFD